MSSIYNRTTIKRLKPEVEEFLKDSYLIDSVYRLKVFRGSSVGIEKSWSEYLKGEFGYNFVHHIRKLDGSSRCWDAEVIVRGLQEAVTIKLTTPVAYEKSLEITNFILAIKRQINDCEITIKTEENLHLGEVFEMVLYIPKRLPCAWHERFLEKLYTY